MMVQSFTNNSLLFFLPLRTALIPHFSLTCNKACICVHLENCKLFGRVDRNTELIVSSGQQKHQYTTTFKALAELEVFNLTRSGISVSRSEACKYYSRCYLEVAAYAVSLSETVNSLKYFTSSKSLQDPWECKCWGNSDISEILLPK